MSAKHTPGPWSLTEPNGVGQGYSLKGPDAWFGYKPWSQETRANVALCAAAPDLLESLEKLLASFDSEIHNEYDGTSMLADRLAEADHARAAIAKARGEA
jgi:hypothetical protein